MATTTIQQHQEQRQHYNYIDNLPWESDCKGTLDPLLGVIVPLLDEFDSSGPRVPSDDGEPAADEADSGHHA
jgi:hypothetical protein